MNNLVKSLFFTALLLFVFSCNRVKTEPVVKESYTNGNPKVVMEYATNKAGTTTLYKETHFFPGEIKFIELKYNEEGLRDGVCASWHENGNKKSEVKYINGKEDGKYRIWHPNGKLFIKGKYDMGNKVAIWEIYDSLGVKTKEEDFRRK